MSASLEGSGFFSAKAFEAQSRLDCAYLELGETRRRGLAGHRFSLSAGGCLRGQLATEATRHRQL